MGRQVVKSYLPTLIIGWRSDGVDYSQDLILFRLVAPPLHPGVAGLISWYGVYGSPAVYHWRKPVVSIILEP
jgi:hypothetical protein